MVVLMSIMGAIQSCQHFGGLHHEYYRQAA